jgi:hypothetical protein
MSKQLPSPADLTSWETGRWIRSLGESECWCGPCEEHKPLPLLGIKPQFAGRPCRSLVTVLTELSRLHNMSIPTDELQLLFYICEETASSTTFCKGYICGVSFQLRTTAIFVELKEYFIYKM